MTTRGAGRPPGRGGPQDRRAAPGAGGPGPHGSHGPLSYSKALAIVVVAVALGAYLLSLGNGHAAAPPATTTTTTTTTAPASTTTTSAPAKTSGPARPSKSVTVLVANASHTTGIAGYYTSQLSKDGWGTLAATTATTVKTTSLVFFAAGQQANADAVATELHLPTTAVHAIGTGVPVPSTAGADVVVVAGLDLAAKVPTTTTTTAG